MNFAKAKRQNVPLLIGLAGPSGSGKTYSALRLARGLAGGAPIAAIDTERGRMLHYADDFDFEYAELDAPFTPQRYGEAIEVALKLKPGVVIVDSFSHEWAGEGGVLDMQQAEFERMGSRDAVKVASWIKPKDAHKKLVNHVLLRLPCHLVVCLRAEEKIEIVKNEKTGRTEVVPKQTLAGHKGWIPVCGKELPYELTVSLVVTPDNPGVPEPIKLEEHHRSLVFTDVPLDEATGERLAAWAKGSVATPSAADKSGASPSPREPESAGPASGSASSDAPEASYEENIKALGALVHDLSERGIVTKRDVWIAVAGMRGVGGDEQSGKTPSDILLELLDGRDANGDARWSPLRDDLTEAEAKELRARLGKKWSEAGGKVPVAA